MHYDFCTLFDRNYLFKGLALHESLQRHVADFTLWVLCMDDTVCEVLTKMRLPQLELISLAQFEDGDLIRAKATRTQVEYCWTCTPSLPLYLLDHVPGVEAITYLDADLYFFGEPAGAYSEMDRGSIGIVEHRFSPAYEAAATSGIFNVAFMVFKNDKYARECLEWWRDRCNEWCYDRMEDGKFGDQKYLDNWPQRFSGVVVLQDAGVGLAPWNLRSHRITMRRGRVLVDGQPLIFYHFHLFLIVGGGEQFRLVDPLYRFGRRSVRLVYQPYIASVRRAMTQVRRTVPDYAYGVRSERLDPLWMRLVAWARRPVDRTVLRMKQVVRARLGRWRSLSTSKTIVPAAAPSKVPVDDVEPQGVDPPDGKAERREADQC